MKEYVSIGKNVDIAIEEGLRFLGLNREDVDIKVLETGGLFKKAKVCLIYEEKVELEPETIVEEVKTEPSIEPVIEQEVEISAQTDTTVELAEVEPKEQEAKPVETETKPVVAPDELKARVEQFLVDLAKKMNIDVTVECEITNNDLNFNVTGQNVGKLIGYRGETLSAIQTILGGLKRAGEGRYRVYLDIGNYKKDREQSIVDLANRMADKAEEIERNVHLDPMNPYERRIVHSALQNRELVETESMGEGEKRHVVIKFKR
ncbi:MAG: KH domain-containing protein [Clostridia bacterium]|nr:KH domain-containing protein [Clostridia bacterium]